MHDSHAQSFGYRCCPTQIAIPGQLPLGVPSHGAHPAPKQDPGLGQVFPGPRPPSPRAGEEDSPLLPPPPPNPGPGTRAAVLGPTPRHIPQPPPRQSLCLAPSPTPCPQRLASPQVSLGKGSSAPRVAHLAEDPAALHRRPRLRLRILLRARRVPALVIRHGGATAEQETGPRSLSCAGGGAQSPR